MTDHDLPEPDERDLLASAYVDGETTPEEAARVEADPALLARAADFRTARALVASPPPPPPGALDAAVREALVDPADQPVVLADARHRRRALTWLGPAAVAAVVLLVLLALPIVLLGVGSTDDSDQTVAGGSADDDTAGEASGDAATSEEGAGGNAGDESTAERDTDDLGAVEDIQTLERQLKLAMGPAAPAVPRTSVADQAGPEASGGGDDAASYTSGFACEGAMRQREPSLGSPVYGARLTYAGEAALVQAFATSNAPGQVVAVVVRQADCSELTRVTL